MSLSSSTEPLECVIAEPEERHTASIIWLHGLGADGYDFAGIVHELNFKAKKNTRFIFPHAPMRPITINNGYVMRGWFDISSLQNIDANEDAEGIVDSAALVSQLIDREIEQGIQPANIVLAGFSQGGVIALHIGLDSRYDLAGVLALSTYFSGTSRTEQKNLSIFMGHGSQDEIIPIRLSEKSCKQLQDAGYPVQWKAYSGMAHSVCMEEIADISRWLDKRL